MSATHIVCPHCNITNRIPSEKLANKPICGKCKKPLFFAKPLELNTTNFTSHISKNDIPVVVDFWAEWCGPCKMMAPMFAQATTQLEPKVRMAKVNTEQEQNIAAQFNIRSIPTLIIFKHGKEIARQSGAMDSQSLIQWVNQHLN